MLYLLQRNCFHSLGVWPLGRSRVLGAFYNTPKARSARLPAIAPGPPQDSVIYWLSTPAVDAIATLAIDPPPAAVRRAFLVRVNLGSVSTASLSGPGPRYATR